MSELVVVGVDALRIVLCVETEVQAGVRAAGMDAPTGGEQRPHTGRSIERWSSSRRTGGRGFKGLQRSVPDGVGRESDRANFG
jgi:hypothetical protein